MQESYSVASDETHPAITPFNPAVDPHVIALRSAESSSPVAIGVRFLGGLAVLNPQQHKIPPRAAQSMLYASLGFDQPTALSHLIISENTYRSNIARSQDMLGVNFRAAMLQRSIALGVLVLLRRATSPIQEVTRRERQVLELLPIVGTDAAIGRELYISGTTVKHYLTNLYNRYSVHRRETLAAGAVLSGFTGMQVANGGHAEVVSRYYESEKQNSGGPYVLLPFNKPCSTAV